jgi:hypothetical protein
VSGFPTVGSNPTLSANEIATPEPALSVMRFFAAPSLRSGLRLRMTVSEGARNDREEAPDESGNYKNERSKS